MVVAVVFEVGHHGATMGLGLWHEVGEMRLVRVMVDWDELKTREREKHSFLLKVLHVFTRDILGMVAFKGC